MKKSKLKFLIVICITMLLSYSCEKKETIDNDENVSEYEVTDEMAIEFAINFLNSKSKLKSTMSVESTHKLQSPFPGKKIFVIQFKPSGFVLMSNSKLNYPVLAFSLSESFDYTDFSQFPPAMSEWLKETVRLNMMIESDTALQRLNGVLQRWDKYSPQLKGGTIIFPDQCTDTYLRHVVEVYDNAIVPACWRQGNPFNSCLDYCGDGYYKPIGCGAVAAGQIMHYWQYPSSINWSAISNYYPSSAPRDCNAPIANFMHNLAEELNTTYTCSGSMVFPSNLVDGLRSYGYSNAEKVDYNFDVVRHNVTWGHPVILKGADGVLSQHYWICDGYWCEYDEYEKSCPSPNGPVISYFDQNFVDFVHLNWGWGNASQNIWYASGRIFKPEGTTSNYSQYAKAIVNIYPPGN